MKKRGIHSLTFKTAAKIVVIITVLIASICLITSVSINNLVTGMTKEKITLLADKNSQTVLDSLNTLEQKASTLADTLLSYKTLDPTTSKDLTKQVFTAALVDQRIFGVYVALEPNLYYQNTPDGYSFYAYRSETGDITYENYSYADYKDGDFYKLAKATYKPAVTEPYSWQLTNGNVVWLVTISVPMLDSHGKFLGVANCDISLDKLGSLSLDLGGYKTSYGFILTNSGNYVDNSADKSKVGTQYKEPGQTQIILSAAKTGTQGIYEDINAINGQAAYKVLVPLKINGIASPWASAFVVNKAEVLQPVTDQVMTILWASLGGVVLLGLLTALFLRFSLKPVKRIVGIATDLEIGRLASKVTVKTKDELGDLAQIFNRTAATLNGYITEITEILRSISDGDLTCAVRRDYKGDFEPIKSALSTILDALNETFVNINTVAEQVSNGSAQLSSGAQTLAASATEQASAMEELTATVAQVSGDVSRNAENVTKASDYIGQASKEVEKSNAYMTELLGAMNGISESSAKISAIIKIIDDISFQTNILALNAAVEAARAGQAGKGFSVVAEEVRSLASKSADAARRTADLINTSIGSVKQGMQLAESTAASLNTLSEKAALVEMTNEQISISSQAQASAIYEIEKGLQQVSGVIQTITATAEENAASSEELSGQAQILFEQARKYKTARYADIGGEGLYVRSSTYLSLPD